jgi:hypothetical protein
LHGLKIFFEEEILDINKLLLLVAEVSGWAYCSRGY